MVTKKQTAIAKEYLEGKTIKGIWVNSNGELFSNEQLAKSSDEDAEFVKADSKELESEQPKETDGADKKATKAALTKTTAAADAKGTDTAPVNEATDADKKAENLKLLGETELVKENYNAMAALVKAFDLETKDRKAETFIEAFDGI